MVEGLHQMAERLRRALRAMPLAVRLAVLPLAGAVPLLVASWVQAGTEAIELREAAAEAALEVALAAARAQNDAVDRIGDFLDTLGQLEALRTAQGDACDTVLSKAVRGQPLVQAALFLDASGIVRCHSEFFRPSDSLLARQDVAGAIAASGPFVGEAFVSPRTGAVIVRIALALREPPGPGGTLRGVVVATVNPAHLPAVAAGGLDPNGGFARNRRFGGLSLHAFDPVGRSIKRHPESAPPLDPTAIDALLARPSGTHVSEASGQVIGFAHVERLGITFAAASPLARIDAASIRIRTEAAVVAGIALLAGCVLAAGLAGILVRRPVARIADAARRIAEGDYEAAHRIGPLPGELDVARLALVRMGERLEMREADAEMDRVILSIHANTDPLTGLQNRRAFERLANDLFARARARDTLVAVLVIDLDHFKLYNDSLGHGAGDDCLRQMGMLLLGVGRQTDIAARMGGEEFALLLPTGREGAVIVAERLTAQLAELALPHPGSPLGRVTASIGIAAAPAAQVDCLDTLLRRADEALYAAKAAGRNGWRVAEDQSVNAVAR